MKWGGKVYYLVPVKEGQSGPLCSGCAFEDEAFNDPDGGCWQAGDGCLTPDETFIWQEEVSQ